MALHPSPYFTHVSKDTAGPGLYTTVAFLDGGRRLLAVRDVPGGQHLPSELASIASELVAEIQARQRGGGVQPTAPRPEWGLKMTEVATAALQRISEPPRRDRVATEPEQNATVDDVGDDEPADARQRSVGFDVLVFVVVRHSSSARSTPITPIGHPRHPVERPCAELVTTRSTCTGIHGRTWAGLRTHWRSATSGSGTTALACPSTEPPRARRDAHQATDGAPARRRAIRCGCAEVSAQPLRL